MTKRAATGKAPVLWVVVYVDTDGKTRVADMLVGRQNALLVLRAWRNADLAGRKFWLVKYIPAPSGKRKGRRK